MELHGFKDNKNRFVVKEFAIVSDYISQSFVFKPPFQKYFLHPKVQRSNDWCERNIHKISWEEGDFVFTNSFIVNLLRPFDKVYTKGLEKKLFLSKFHDNVFELDKSWSVSNCFQVSCCLVQHMDVNVKCALRSALNLYHLYKKDEMCSATYGRARISE